LIENDVRNDIEKVYINVMKELKRKEWLVAEVLSPLLSLLFPLSESPILGK
jgi:hypothetical protein